MRVRENPFSGIFYVVQLKLNDAVNSEQIFEQTRSVYFQTVFWYLLVSYLLKTNTSYIYLNIYVVQVLLF